ncbi:ribose 5-phosphate isomerase A [Amorphus suaedae]
MNDQAGAASMKEKAAAAALAHVERGMRLGLGTGSTAEIFVRLLGERVAEGLTVDCVATSERTATLARELRIPLSTLDELPELDLTVDGADELDDRLRLVKGGGGALLREKIVAAASAKMIVIADASKRVETLGRFPLPIEVVPFGLQATLRAIGSRSQALGLDGPLTVRQAAGGGSYLTDGGHLIVDAAFGRIPEPEALAETLNSVPGVVEHGLFIGLASAALIADTDAVIHLVPA